MSKDREEFIQRMIEERDLSSTMAAYMWDNRGKPVNLVECDSCPTSGGCVETCMKAPNKPATPSEDGGEVPEVVAWLILGGIFDHRELGDIDYHIAPDVAERLQMELVKTTQDVDLELMTVAQHSRIVAAKDAEIARLKEDRDE